MCMRSFVAVGRYNISNAHDVLVFWCRSISGLMSFVVVDRCTSWSVAATHPIAGDAYELLVVGGAP